MKKLLIIIFIFSSIQLFSQEKKFNIQVGAGPSIHNFCKTELTFETELNYYINKYFTSSISFNYTGGFCNFLGITKYDYYQGNLTIFISPFKNTRKNDFRLGYGISELYYRNFTYYREIFKTGHNIVIENNYKINSKYIIGLKLLENIYLSSEQKSYEHLNFGGLLKFGIIL